MKASSTTPACTTSCPQGLPAGSGAPRLRLPPAPRPPFAAQPSWKLPPSVTPASSAMGAVVCSSSRACGTDTSRSRRFSGSRTSPAGSVRPKLSNRLRNNWVTRAGSSCRPVPAVLARNRVSPDCSQPSGSATRRARLRTLARSAPTACVARPSACSTGAMSGTRGSSTLSSSALATVVSVRRGSRAPRRAGRSGGSGNSGSSAYGAARWPSLKSSASDHSGVPGTCNRNRRPVATASGCKRSCTCTLPLARFRPMSPRTENAPARRKAAPSSRNATRPSASTRIDTPAPSDSSTAGLPTSLTPSRLRRRLSRVLRQRVWFSSGISRAVTQAAGSRSSSSQAPRRGTAPRALGSSSSTACSRARSARQAGSSPGCSDSRRDRSVLARPSTPRNWAMRASRRTASGSTPASARCSQAEASASSEAQPSGWMA